jgi:glycosyltransferase involved in cell wall biosynthesis
MARMPGRVLMVVHSQYPVGEPRVRRQAEAAAAAGWNVEVLALASSGAPSVERCGGVTVFRTRVQRKRSMTMSGLVAEYGRFFWATFVHSLRSQHADVIVVANPPDFLVMAPLAQRLRGASVILDIHDLMTDLFAVRLQVERSDPRYRLLLLVERLSLGCADLVMTVHGPYADEIYRRTRGRVTPTIVMNSADDALFPRRQELPSGSCLFLYHGSLFERYGVLDLVRAFGKVSSRVRDARLWIAGDGDCRADLLRETRLRGLGDHVWISDGMLPADEVRNLLAQAHVGVIPNQPNELNRFALSTKLFEYIATGVPVVCAGLPTLRAHFADDELLFYEPGRVDDLAEKLLWSAQHPREMMQRAARASAHYDADYSWPRQKAAFLRLLETCLQ